MNIALISAGAMGAAVGRRLTDHGARVLTSLDGRGRVTVERARAAGMIAATDAELIRAEMILSIVPPADAEALARRLLPAIAAAERKPLYVDLNALSPASKRGLADLLGGAGCAMLDGAIIGPPPQPNARATTVYVSGPGADAAAPLARLGLDLRVMDEPIGAASALKMCYAGINKGLVALGTAMLLGAERSGAAPTLKAEMAASMPELLARFRRQIPDMYPKAYRWVAEMREIAAFLEDDPAAAMIYEGIARLYERIADDVAADGADRHALDNILGS